MSNAVAETKPRLVAKFAERFSVDPDKLLTTLKHTCFKVKDGEVNNEQMMALLVVADQYKLNPFTKEIFAFPDKQNGIVPVVSVDGWTRIINEHPQYDGVEFRYSDELAELPGAKECPEWCEAVIYRKDRTRPTVVREYLDEVYRPPFKARGREGGSYEVTGPWQTHTKRFLRHKALIQCARIAFGFAGIYDEDEAERIAEAGAAPMPAKPGVRMPQAREPGVVDGEFSEVKEGPKGAAAPAASSEGQPQSGPIAAGTSAAAASTQEPPPPEADLRAAAKAPIEEVVTPAMAKMIRVNLKDGRTESQVAEKFGVGSIDLIPKAMVNSVLKYARSGQ